MGLIFTKADLGPWEVDLRYHREEIKDRRGEIYKLSDTITLDTKYLPGPYLIEILDVVGSDHTMVKLRISRK